MQRSAAVKHRVGVRVFLVDRVDECDYRKGRDDCRAEKNSAIGETREEAGVGQA